MKKTILSILILALVLSLSVFASGCASEPAASVPAAQESSQAVKDVIAMIDAIPQFVSRCLRFRIDPPGLFQPAAIQKVTASQENDRDNDHDQTIHFSSPFFDYYSKNSANENGGVSLVFVYTGRSSFWSQKPVIDFCRPGLVGFRQLSEGQTFPLQAGDLLKQFLFTHSATSFFFCVPAAQGISVRSR